MAKMIKCKTCGYEIAKSAKTCPSCGAKNKKGILLPVVGVVVAIAVVGSMGGSDEPEKIGDVSTTESSVSSAVQGSASTPSAPEKTIFGVGEKVELNGVNATLLSVTENNGQQFFEPAEGNVFVVCEFEIENNTNGDIAVSSMLSFDAYFDDYSANLDIAAMSMSDKTQLDGTVAAGKKMKGVVAYQAPFDWNTVELHFTPSVWSGRDIVFTHSK